MQSHLVISLDRRATKKCVWIPWREDKAIGSFQEGDQGQANTGLAGSVEHLSIFLSEAEPPCRVSSHFSCVRFTVVKIGMSGY